MNFEPWETQALAGLFCEFFDPITEKRLFHRGTQILYIQTGWKWGKSPDLLVWGLQMFAVESDLKVFWSHQSCRPIFDISQWRQTFLEPLFNTYQVTTPEYTNGSIYPLGGFPKSWGYPQFSSHPVVIHDLVT